MIRGGLMLLGTGLGGEGEGQLLAAGLSNDDFLLFNGDTGVSEFSNIEALLLNLIRALDLSDCNRLGHTNLAGGGVGQLAGLL